ncbi:MAG: fibronectin type III domain-containing protein [Eubacterium sp.]|nr:fibronectin type III domain-containing protein [Eubacterium sp.]
MKKSKIIISILLALVIAMSFAACKSGDSNKSSKKGEGTTAAADIGEQPENGDAPAPADATPADAAPADGKTPENGANPASGGNNANKTATTKKSGKDSKKPSAPKNVSGVKATEVTTTSITLEWNKVKCTAYQVYMSRDGVKWSYISKKLDKNTITIKNLHSYTDYYFSVRAYNANDKGAVASKWTKSLLVKTKPVNNERNIKINVKLPAKGNNADKVRIYINDEKKPIDEHSVTLTGDTYSFKTPKKYKGVVKVKAVLVKENVKDAVKTDKDTVNLDLSAVGIENVNGGRD